MLRLCDTKLSITYYRNSSYIDTQGTLLQSGCSVVLTVAYSRACAGVWRIIKFPEMGNAFETEDKRMLIQLDLLKPRQHLI